MDLEDDGDDEDEWVLFPSVILFHPLSIHPFVFKKNVFVCSDDEDDDDDEDDEEEDDEEEDIEESPVKARWCFGSSAEYIWWVVSLIFFNLFWVQAKATLSKKKPPAQNGKSPKPNAPAQKQVIYLPFYFQKGSHDILLLVTNITVLFSDTFSTFL